MPMHKTLYYRMRRQLRWLKPKVTGKLIWYLLLVSILPLLLFVASSLDITRKMVLHIAQDYSGQLLTNQRDYLQLLTEQVESLASNIATAEDIGDVMSPVAIDAGAYHELSTQAKIGYILNGHSNLRGLVSIDLFSYLGYHFHVGEALPTAQIDDVARQKLYQAALDSTRPLMWAGVRENFHVSSGQRQVVSAVKVIYHYYPKTQQSNPVGMLVINYSPEYLYQHFSKLNFGQGSYFLVVDQHNRLIFHPEKARIGESLVPPLQALLKGKQMAASVELDGQQVLFSQAKLNNTNWRVVLLVPEQTLLLPMRGLLRNAAILLFLCFAAIALVAYRYTRSVVVPIKAISSGFRHIQRGPSASLAPLSVPQNKDEIAEMVVWFNAFLDGIKGREENERQLRQAKLAADLANQSKSEFLANMSHEIRTPMNAILGMTQLAMSATLESARSNYLNKANRAAYSLLGIINDILDISKIEAGKIVLEEVALQLNNIVAEVAEVLASGAQEKGLELLIDLDPGLPFELIGDPLRLRQILLNLVGNAIKFTERGHIILRLQLQEQDEHSALLRIAVKDSGIGISQEQQNNLFQQFSQADSSTTRRYGGTGLGLSICKHLVELMHGSIGLQSELGVGSEFFFLLRMTKTATRAPACNISLPHDLQLLIIDDNPQTRAVLNRMANQLQLPAHGFAKTDDAHAWLASQPNANLVCLLDYPLQSAQDQQLSFTCYQQIRSLPGRTQLPVIWMTNQELTEDLLQDKLQTLAKPFLLSALRQALQQACGLASNHSKKSNKVQKEFKTALQGRRVLLVEDNMLNQELALALLSNVGIEADLAHHGAQALEKLAVNHYDAVLMDCQMPVMDGYQATRILRSQAEHANLPILALTAHALVGEREKSLAAGMNEHLTKPIKPTVLYEALLHWMAPRPTQTLPVPSKDMANQNASNANNQAGAKLEEDVDAIMAQLAQQQSALEQAAHFAPEQALENLLGNQKMFQRMSSLFLQEALDFAPQFRAAWQNTRTEADSANGHLEHARRLAHTMKSSSAIVGALYLQELARDLEQACLAAQDEEIARHLQLVENELALVAVSLKQYLARLT